MASPTAAIMASAATVAASQNDNMFLAENYEDLLATAIINKVCVLKTRLKKFNIINFQDHSIKNVKKSYSCNRAPGNALGVEKN